MYIDGDGGSRTHVQRHRHSCIYEHSQYIVFRGYFSLLTGFHNASLIGLFLRPQTAAYGVAHLE